MLDHKLKEKKSLNIATESKAELWKVEPSTTAKNCKNFIREIVDNLDLKPNPEKPVIALSLGAYLFSKICHGYGVKCKMM